MTLSPLVNFIIGLAVLLLGRHLFWLFVAVAGFVLGVMVAPQLLPGQPGWLILLYLFDPALIGLSAVRSRHWVIINPSGSRAPR